MIVRVLSYEGQRFSVQGSVTKGGQFYLSDQPVSIYTALGLAGGVSDKGDNTYIQLIRNGRTYNLNTIELERVIHFINFWFNLMTLFMSVHAKIKNLCDG